MTDMTDATENSISTARTSLNMPNEDIFDSVVMAEERFHEEGYQEGLSAGCIAGQKQGAEMGQVKGRQIGSEFGFYLGFVAAWQQLIKQDPTLAKPRTVKSLEALHALLIAFNVDDVSSENYWDDFKKIRDRFKQVASLLNVSLDFTADSTQKPVMTF